MKQEAGKIYNIEHVDSIHIDASDLFTAEDKYNMLNQVIERVPGIIESTIAMLSSRAVSDKRNFR